MVLNPNGGYVFPVVSDGGGGGGGETSRNPLELLYTEGAEITAEDWGSANVRNYTISGSTTYLTPVSYYGCNFKKITFPNTQIGTIAFIRNHTLEEVVCASMTASQRSTNFLRECENLKKITLGENCLPFVNYAFLNCNSLKEVRYLGTIDKWASATRDSQAQRANPFGYSGGGAFYLGDSTEPLTVINLTTATDITKGAFFNFDYIEKAILGETVASIAAEAFAGCTSIETLILKGDTVKTLSSTNAFSVSSIANGTGTIYIQPETVDEATLVAEYKAATNWSTYEAQIKPYSEYTGGAA